MYLSYLRIIGATVYLLHHLELITGASDSPVQHYPVDDIAINCGSSGTSSAFDGREWIGDMGSPFTASPKEDKSKAVRSSVHQSVFTDFVPYMTARISRAQFTYTFQLSPGQKFIRLHFYPASYPGFERSKAIFNVKAGPFTLLSNFSACLNADAFGVSYFAKEFCVNIEEHQAFTISFSPYKSSTATNDVYAFVNGIEIVSMPTSLYYTSDGELGARVVGNKFFRYHIDNATALEMVHRLNVGGRSILSVEDLGMFRVWSEDKNYFIQSSLLRVSGTSNTITYTNIPTYSAPSKVYQTSWSLDSSQESNQINNFTWKLPVDLGFRYLVRLHFCEPEPMTAGSGQKQFDLLIYNKMVEADANVMKWSGGIGIAVYRDYVVMMEGDRMEGKRELIIALQLKYDPSSTTKKIDSILRGIEVFKLTNPDNNLASVNPIFTADASMISRTPRLQKLVISFGSINTIALVLTLLNFILYHLNRFKSNSSKITTSSSSSSSSSSLEEEEELNRRFSLVEIQLATNNFDDGLVLGKGGFGNVYKGLIDRTRTVAIKRLNSQSNQGVHEFWAEINTLSKLRHNNLVSLIGYCDDFQEMILVYEYMAHGTLAHHVHKASRNGSGNSPPLSWQQRLNICIGTARGLDFLHTNRGGHHGIIHRDVKSTNILLDENWVPKISDFGLSKMNTSRTHVSTKVKGTFGYMDPEYFMTQRLTKRSDVFAFGVVLFEVLCGRQAVDFTLEEEEHSLSLWARQCIRKGRIDQLVDPSVKDQIPPHCLRRFAEIANKCLHDQPNERPTMAEIVARLDLITLELQGRDSSCTEQEVFDDWNITTSEDSTFTPRLHHSHLEAFSLHVLLKATDSFSEDHKVGTGSFGSVYYATLEDGRVVAIKRAVVSASTKRQKDDEFLNEIRLLCQLNHKNLVRLLGFCEECNERLLVFDYMSNGTLYQRLHVLQRSPLRSWTGRVKVALDVARGVEYLHVYSVPPIIHRDIKSSNILLDAIWTAKVSDFGLSLIGPQDEESHLSLGAVGTVGYMDPEYYRLEQLTTKSDVYSFGVVLLELLSGYKPIHKNDNGIPRNVVDFVVPYIIQNEIHRVLDRKVPPPTPFEMEPLTSVGYLAADCVMLEARDRPTMTEVVNSLERALAACLTP